MSADKDEGSLRMVECRNLRPSCRGVAGLALPANDIIVVVGMTTYAGLRETAIGPLAVCLHFYSDQGISNILECVAGTALGGGMLTHAGEACRSVIKGLLVEPGDGPLMALMLFMAGNAFLRGTPEMVSRLCVERLLDVGVASKALRASDDRRSLMALRAVVQPAQMLMSG